MGHNWKSYSVNQKRSSFGNTRKCSGRHPEAQLVSAVAVCAIVGLIKVITGKKEVKEYGEPPVGCGMTQEEWDDAWGV